MNVEAPTTGSHSGAREPYLLDASNSKSAATHQSLHAIPNDDIVTQPQEVSMLWLGSVLLFVSSFAGTWSGNVVADKSAPLLMVLSQEGSDVSGTFGRDLQTQWKITTSKIEGDTLTVEVAPGSVFRLVLKLDGDKLAGAVFKD